MTTVVSAARLIDGTGLPPLSNASVIVDKGRIIDVARDIVAGNHQVIDLDGLTLLPGLVDAHAHLIIGHSPWSVERYVATSEASKTAHALENAARALRGGVTTLRDCGGPTETLVGLRHAIEVGAAQGPRLVVSGSPITTTGGHLWYLGTQADTEGEVREAARRAIQRGVDFIKVVASGGQMTPASNARTAQYSLEELSAIVEVTRQFGTYATAHCHATSSIERVLDAGFSMIEHCSFLTGSDQVGQEFHTERSYAYDPELTERVVAGGIWVGQFINAVQRNIYLGRTDLYAEGQLPLLRREVLQRAEILRDMHSRGVRLVAGSDGSLDIAVDLVASVELAVLEVGMTCMEAIVHATSRAAEAIGLNREAGSIELGKSADLIAVEGNPLDDIKALRNIRWVMARGDVVKTRN